MSCPPPTACTDVKTPNPVPLTFTVVPHGVLPNGAQKFNTLTTPVTFGAAGVGLGVIVGVGLFEIPGAGVLLGVGVFDGVGVAVGAGNTVTVIVLFDCKSESSASIFIWYIPASSKVIIGLLIVPAKCAFVVATQLNGNDVWNWQAVRPTEVTAGGFGSPSSVTSIAGSYVFGNVTFPVVGAVICGAAFVGVGVGVFVGVLVGVGVFVGVLVGVGVAVLVGDGVNVGVGVFVGDGVKVGVLVGVLVGIGVAVGTPVQSRLLATIAFRSNPSASIFKFALFQISVSLI